MTSDYDTQQDLHLQVEYENGSTDDEWHQTYLELGYIFCRPCGEYQRPPECVIDEQGRALTWDGVPWEDVEKEVGHD